jgi:hypothetical protein
VYGWENTSRFQSHEACPSCGSKDNLARYEGGSGYCFGCGRYEPGSLGATVTRSIRQVVDGRRESKDVVRPPPDDTDLGGYPELVIEWIAKYGLSVSDLIFRDVGWSKNREQLIYQFYGEGDDLVLWQARNFRSGTGHKDRFFTSGSPADVIATYHSRKSTDTACLVEDCVSGIVVANSGSADGIPCFSAAMPEKKLARIAKMYKKVFIWLDNDKFKESQKIARQLGLMGVTTRVIHTQEDPKCYPYDYIEAKLV